MKRKYIVSYEAGGKCYRMDVVTKKIKKAEDITELEKELREKIVMPELFITGVSYTGIAW